MRLNILIKHAVEQTIYGLYIHGKKQISYIECYSGIYYISVANEYLNQWPGIKSKKKLKRIEVIYNGKYAEIF
jgi:hypothetical protein